MSAPDKKIKITLTRSMIGRPEKHKKIARALGFKRMHQTIEHNDCPMIRGMVNKIIHMVSVE